MAGDTLGTSDWLEIEQDRIQAFANATGDRQWIHVDIDRATREIGGPIAHGALIISLIPLLRKSAFVVKGQARTVNYGSNRVRFLTPVKAGARIRLHARLFAATPRPSGILATFEYTIELEGATKPACIAEALSLYSGAEA